VFGDLALAPGQGQEEPELVAGVAGEQLDPGRAAVCQSPPGGTVRLTLIMIYFTKVNTRCGGHARYTVGILCLQ
jgi:hypothetical protein